MDSLVVYSMMFPLDPGDERPGPEGGQTALLPLAEGPCPSCTALLDQLEGAAEHVAQRANLVAVAKAPLSRLLSFAEEHGWRRLRLLSSAANTYNRDYLGETGGVRPAGMSSCATREGPCLCSDLSAKGVPRYCTRRTQPGLEGFSASSAALGRHASGPPRGFAFSGPGSTMARQRTAPGGRRDQERARP